MLVEPVSAAIQAQWNEFKDLPAREQKKIILSMVFENLTTGLINECVGFAANKVVGRGAQLVGDIAGVADKAKLPAITDKMAFAGDFVVFNDAEIADAIEAGIVNEMAAANNGLKSGVQAAEVIIDGNEVILPKVKTFEQARNKILKILDDKIGQNSKPYFCRLKKSKAYGKILDARRQTIKSGGAWIGMLSRGYIYI